MKQYPSILPATGTLFREIPGAYIWDKLDGRNVRVEWSKKKGFHKWGSRHRLFDASDPEYAVAPTLYDLESLTRIFTDQRWQDVTAFFELWQKHSLGGLFVPGERYHMTLIDVNPYKQGILGPREFLKLFGNQDRPRLIDRCNWTRGFVECVRRNEIDGVTFEGVVAKAGEGHKLVMAKAKTQQWIDAILARYGEEEGRKIINS